MSTKLKIICEKIVKIYEAKLIEIYTYEYCACVFIVRGIIILLFWAC